MFPQSPNKGNDDSTPPKIRLAAKGESFTTKLEGLNKNLKGVEVGYVTIIKCVC